MPVEPHYHRCTFGCSDGLSLASLIVRDRVICAAKTEDSGFMRSTTCTLPTGHDGWHQDGQGMSWTLKSSSEEKASG
jgi:hypothetical protein